MTTTHARPTPASEPTGHLFPVAEPTSTPATSNARRISSAGPAVGLVELPDPAEMTLTSPNEVDAHLVAIETARQKQLDALPAFNRDTVTAAYRATVEQILADVRAARDRLAAGTYGICTRCTREIPEQRLERRPWVSMCTPCARHESS
jgi:RNA polymerase-binding transcription factor DksA